MQVTNTDYFIITNMLVHKNTLVQFNKQIISEVNIAVFILQISRSLKSVCFSVIACVHDETSWTVKISANDNIFLAIIIFVIYNCILLSKNLTAFASLLGA